MAKTAASLAVGDELPTVVKVMSQEKMDSFESFYGSAVSEEPADDKPVNIHTDAAMAEAAGLSSQIASGQMSFSYIHEMLARFFGDAFIRGGSLKVSFISPTYAGDVVTARGIVKEKTREGNATQLTLEVWTENPAGKKTTPGTATVVLPRRR